VSSRGEDTAAAGAGPSRAPGTSSSPLSSASPALAGSDFTFLNATTPFVHLKADLSLAIL